MKTIIAINAIIGLMFVGQSFQQSHEKVNLTLYYEPLCPSSRQFIRSLVRSYPKIDSILNLVLNPYGNTERSKVNDHWVFDCQHGVNECKLAIITACSFYQLDQSEQVELLGCLSSTSVARKCITDVNLNYTEIRNCANGDLGEELLAKYGEETDALVPPHPYVPYILFNDVFNKVLEEKAEENLVETVCSLIHTDDKPPACLKDNNV